MQCLFLKLLNKRKTKSLQLKKYIYHTTKTIIIIIPELIILLMNTVLEYPSLVNVIVFCRILTPSNGLINSISDIKKYEYNKLTNKKKY
jgi:hypothetical protein